MFIFSVSDHLVSSIRLKKSFKLLKALTKQIYLQYHTFLFYKNEILTFDLNIPLYTLVLFQIKKQPSVLKKSPQVLMILTMMMMMSLEVLVIKIFRIMKTMMKIMRTMMTIMELGRQQLKTQTVSDAVFSFSDHFFRPFLS